VSILSQRCAVVEARIKLTERTARTLPRMIFVRVAEMEKNLMREMYKKKWLPNTMRKSTENIRMKMRMVFMGKKENVCSV
jgi:hypothetical protein